MCFFVFEDALWTHLLKYTKGDPEWNDKSKQEQQQPESHPGNQKEKYNTENTHIWNLLNDYRVKLINNSNQQIKLATQKNDPLIRDLIRYKCLLSHEQIKKRLCPHNRFPAVRVASIVLQHEIDR